MARQFAELGDAATRRLYSVTWAVTNRCPFKCWHCYNAGRSQQDVPLEVLRDLAGQLQGLGAVMVTLTGGEPLLRADLPEIIGSFDARSCLILGTTGEGLTPQLAQALHQKGLFAVGISLDSAVEADHDRLRGRAGAFQTALRGLEIAREAGLYPYVVSVGTREFLERSRFMAFLRFVAQAGALEVHLLEPSATGKLTGHTDVLLSGQERQSILNYQAEAAQDETLPVVSSFAYLESPEAFGCGAGLTHLYIDGSGEVCPCNLVPLSFGNITRTPFRQILDRMGEHFCHPRQGCVGRMLARQFPSAPVPACPEISERICEMHLPRAHARPAFFRIRDEARGEDVGPEELRSAYDGVHQNYDEFWLSAAAKPIEELVEKLSWNGREHMFEAGCGTGYGTALLARKGADLLAVDLSAGMQTRARGRLKSLGLHNVRFEVGDALAALEREREREFDLVFSSWVLGYIPLAPFFRAAARALKPGGRLAFVVHRENSPREPLEIFAELVAADPTVLQKRVAFDFPSGPQQLSILLRKYFEINDLWTGAAVFNYPTAEQVLEHLLKSGAGTAFYEAIDPARRPALTQRFLERLRQANDAGETLREAGGARGQFRVVHDYVSCIVTRNT